MEPRYHVAILRKEGWEGWSLYHNEFAIGLALS